MLLDDQEIFDPKRDLMALRRRIGMIFQRPNPFPLSVRRNLELPLKPDSRLMVVTGFLPPDGLLWRPPPNSAHDNLVLDAAHAFHVASDLSRALTFALGIHSTSELDISVQRSHAYVAEMNHRVFYELGANAVGDGGVVGILRDTLPALKHVTGPDRRGQNQGHQQADC